MDIKSRYEGLQTLLTRIGTDGCLFLSLCSIAEEVSGKPVDLITVIKVSIKNGWLSEDYTVNDSTALLHWLTGKIVARKVVSKLPTAIQDNEYTVCRYYNKRTGFTHFRRRGFDTLVNSVTVKEGNIIAYYIYVFE